MRKFIPAVLIIMSLIYIVYSFVDNYSVVDSTDGIRDVDEKLIKNFRSYNSDYYTPDILRSLQIIYLDEIDGYRIYLVEDEGDISLSEYKGWQVDEYAFPSGTSTRIIGVRGESLYIFGKLVHETDIDIERVYDLVIRTRDRQ